MNNGERDIHFNAVGRDFPNKHSRCVLIRVVDKQFDTFSRETFGTAMVSLKLATNCLILVICIQNVFCDNQMFQGEPGANVTEPTNVTTPGTPGPQTSLETGGGGAGGVDTAATTEDPVSGTDHLDLMKPLMLLCLWAPVW